MDEQKEVIVLDVSLAKFGSFVYNIHMANSIKYKEQTFNIGDMLDRMTRGVYRSNLHRVRNTAGRDRISFPLFFDPAFTSRPAPIEGMDAIAAFEDDGAARWDGASVHTFDGTYGDYLVSKVSKVFPQLAQRVS